MYLLDRDTLPSSAMRNARVVQSELAGILREYYHHGTPGIRTVLLRRAAEVQFELRQIFNDLLGTSFGYREMVTEAYGMAGIPQDERKTVLDAVRYHMMNVLREKLPPEQVKALHLRAEDGRERARASRKETRAVIDEAKARLGKAGPLLRGVIGAREILSSIKAGDLRALSESDRRDVIRAVTSVQREAERILRLADGRHVTPPRKKK